MHKNFPFFYIFIFLLTIFIAPVNAYDDKTTHPALTDEIIDFYNLSFPDKQLTPQQKEWIIDGSILEDTPPRWINHFYDPINKIGWSGEYAGIYDKNTVQIVSQNLIAPYGITPVSSLEWLHNEQLQARYGFYKGAKTWERGILEMIKGNEEEAYKILGYILHLIEDASVPDHTRNDTHAHELEKYTNDYGSPYEEYLKKYTRETIKKDLNLAVNLKNQGFSIAQRNSIDEYLIFLAEYSNRYFFSKDTINDSKYQFPKIIREDDNFGYGLDENGKEFPLARIWFYKNNNQIIKSYIIDKNDEYIIKNYFSYLSRQAVLNGAGVIGLFHTEAASKKEYPNKLINYDFSVFNYFEIPRISITAEIIKIKDVSQSLLGQASSAVSDIFSSIGGLFSDISGLENSNNAPKQDVIGLDNNLNRVGEEISVLNSEILEIPATTNNFITQASGNTVNNSQNEKLAQLAQIQAQLNEIKSKAESLNQQVQALSQKSSNINNSPIIYVGGGGGGGSAPVILSVSGNGNANSGSEVNQQSNNQQEATQDSQQNSTSTNQTASSTENILENILITTSTTETATSSQKIATSSVVISEILFDAEGSDKGKEFIELYNLTTSTIDLDNWSLKYYRENSTSVKSLAVFGAKPEDKTLISGEGFLLIGLNDYDAINYNNVPADILRNENLPNGNEKIIVILYNGQDIEIDRIIYDKNSIDNEGQSLERFGIRAVPNPKNSLNSFESQIPPSETDENFPIIQQLDKSVSEYGSGNGEFYQYLGNGLLGSPSSVTFHASFQPGWVPQGVVKPYFIAITFWQSDNPDYSNLTSISINTCKFSNSISEPDVEINNCQDVYIESGVDKDYTIPIQQSFTFDPSKYYKMIIFTYQADTVYFYGSENDSYIYGYAAKDNSSGLEVIASSVKDLYFVIDSEAPIGIPADISQSAPQNFEVNYSTSTSELILSWQEPRYFNESSPALTYKIKDTSYLISSSTLVLPDIATTATSAIIAVNEVGRKYKFSIQGFDDNGNKTLEVLSRDILIPYSLLPQFVIAQQLDGSIAEVGESNGEFYQTLGSGLSGELGGIAVKTSSAGRFLSVYISQYSDNNYANLENYQEIAFCTTFPQYYSGPACPDYYIGENVITAPAKMDFIFEPTKYYKLYFITYQSQSAFYGSDNADSYIGGESTKIDYRLGAIPTSSVKDLYFAILSSKPL